MSQEMTQREILELPEATTWETIWSRTIKGTRVLIPYEGTMELQQNADGIFQIKVTVTKPANITVTRPISGDGKDTFRVSIIACRTNTTAWKHTSTHIYFKYHVEANYFGWFDLYNGPISGQLKKPDALEAAINEARTTAQSLEDEIGLENIGDEHFSLP